MQLQATLFAKFCHFRAELHVFLLRGFAALNCKWENERQGA